jgi:hypothetical protein
MVRESMVASLLSPERYSFMLRIWCAGVVINVRMKLKLKYTDTLVMMKLKNV